jgi:hypothetical protein
MQASLNFTPACFIGVVRMSEDKYSKPPVAERRPKQRKRVLMAGIVTYADGAYSFDCTFRNLSETGALVAVGKNIPFPSQFYLIVLRDRVAYEARVVRNNGYEVGVRFQKQLSISDISDPSLNYLKRLWLAKVA